MLISLVQLILVIFHDAVQMPSRNWHHTGANLQLQTVLKKKKKKVNLQC